MKTILFILAGLSWAWRAQADEVFTGKVIKVIDGNTIEVVTQGVETYTFKLYGINCPELGQDYGDKAKSYLESLVLGKQVTINPKGKDRWGTRLCALLSESKIDPRSELLKEGLAWTTEVNPDPDLEAIKEKARANGNGLWKEKDPTPPWTFRRQQSMAQVKSS